MVNKLMKVLVCAACLLAGTAALAQQASDMSLAEVLTATLAHHGDG